MKRIVVTLLSVSVWTLINFTVFSGVRGDMIDLDVERSWSQQIVQKEFFDQLESEDDTVVGWLTGDRGLKTRNIMKKYWRTQNQFVQDTFYYTTYPIRNFLEDEEETSIIVENIENSTHNHYPVNPSSVICSEESQGEGEKESIDSAGCRYITSEDILICDNMTLTTMPKLPDYLTLFELNLTSVEILGRNAFGNSTIETIKLDANSLTCLHPDAFEGVVGLQVLSINHNSIQMIRLEEFKTLNETFAIYLEHNRINLSGYEDPDSATTPKPPSYGYGYNKHNFKDRKEMEEEENDTDDQPVLPELVILSLIGNPLQIIPERYFYPIRASPLKILSLGCCQLTNIEQDAFKYLPHLNELDLSENPKLMGSLDIRQTGVNTTSLKTLNLADNNLAQIPSKILSALGNLESLDLHGNLFDTLWRDCFSSSLYKTLKSLNLDNCRIRSIGADTFKDFENLDSLKLVNNRLSTIPQSISHLAKLKYLDISGNIPADSTYSQNSNRAVFKISVPVFANLSQLEYLSMINLDIPSIERTTFQGLVNLKILLASDTKSLQSIADYSFADLSSLKVLDLTNGKLKSISQFTFTGLVSVETLLLSHNDISFESLIDTDTGNRSMEAFIGGNYNNAEPFHNMPNLKFLHLTNNKIRYIYASYFSGLSNLQMINLQSNSVHSWEERVFDNNTALQELYLGYNNIGPITPAMLEDFQRLELNDEIVIEENLDISNNPLVCGKNMCQVIGKVRDGSLSLRNWYNNSFHTCLDTNTNKYYDMKTLNISGEICDSKVEEPENTEEPNVEDPDDPIDPRQPDPTTIEKTVSFATTFAVIFLCIFFVSSAGVIGYKKRFHLKYFWFVVKFNVVNVPNLNIGKRRASLIPAFEYDIFVSYNHTDRGFIEDHLMPKIEGFPNPSFNEKEELVETYKDIESDKYDKGGGSGSDSSKFKVCIHERDFKAGVPITDNIVDFVDRSRKVVVVVSKNYLESQWCLYEMNLAYHRLIESGRRSFLVILLEDIPVTLRTKSLNYLLLSRTYLEWPGTQASQADRNNFWKRLRNSLCNTSH